MTDIDIAIPTGSGDKHIHLPGKNLIFVVGPNGSGKSALLEYLSRYHNSRTTKPVLFLPGSRVFYFDADQLSITPRTRSEIAQKTNGFQPRNDIRVRPVAGTTKNECILYDLQKRDTAHKLRQYNIGLNANANAEGEDNFDESPLDAINELLGNINFSFHLINSADCIEVRKGNDVYSFAQLSDGERATILLVAELYMAPKDSVIIIDEPDLHINRSIINSVLDFIVDRRGDCAFIISTHDIDSISRFKVAPVVLVRDCGWSSNGAISWDFDLIDDVEHLPEDIRSDILGARRRVIFVEGITMGRDDRLYSYLFPNYRIQARKSCNEVRRAVVGVSNSESMHHVKAFGIVDNDSMDQAFRDKLLGERVMSLDVYSIESIYYSKDVVRAVAKALSIRTQNDELSLVNRAEQRALVRLKQSGIIEALAQKIATRRVRDQIMSSMPSAEDVRSQNQITITIQSQYNSVYSELKHYIDSGALYSIIDRCPVRETGILKEIAIGLGFSSVKYYEDEVLRLIIENSELNRSIKSRIYDVNIMS